MERVTKSCDETPIERLYVLPRLVRDECSEVSKGYMIEDGLKIIPRVPVVAGPGMETST